MTFYTKLKEDKTEHGRTVTAWKYSEKYSAIDEYCVDISEGSCVIISEKCARTTWRKKFEQMRMHSGL